MHIVHLTLHWSATGGPSKYVARLQRDLGSLGHRVGVITTDSGEGAEVAAGPFPVRDARMIARLRQLNPDIVHVHGSVRLLFSALVYRLLRRHSRVVFTFHTQPRLRRYLPGFDEGRGDYGLAASWVARGLIGKADLVTSVSESIVIGHNEAYGFAIGRFACIPSGGDPRPPSAPPDGVLAMATGRRPLLVSIGVMAWDWKVAGHLVAVRAVDLLRHCYPRVLLLIAGDGLHRAIVERELVMLGLQDHVKMLGNVPPDPLLEAADIYVHMAMNEGCSLAIIEAMHAGKPIVAADAAGIPEVLVDGDSALLIEPEPQRLAEAIRGLVEDESNRRQLGARAREVALERYTWSIVARQYAEAYATALQGC